MNVLLRNVTLVQPGQSGRMSTTDVLIRNGLVEAIGKKLPAAKVKDEIDCNGLYLSPGWLDFQANLCDPGFEYKEDIITGLNAAAAGGFTGVVTTPNTQPCIDSKANVEYVLRKAQGHLVNVFPCASITTTVEGKHMSEMLDLHNAGAVAFTDGEHSVQDAGTIVRALQYVKPFNGLVVNKPEEKSLTKGGMMNESAQTVRLGLKPMPPMAEELMVTRDISLAEYTNCRIMIGPISTAGSVALIRNAKKKGVKVECFVNALNLLLDDTELESFDSNFKLNPPLRTKSDVKALHKGLKDGTIDIVASGHQPQNDELKRVEFDYAAFGAIGLQTSFATATTALGNTLDAEQYVNVFAVNPRRAIGKPVPVIAKGEAINATLFSLDAEWDYILKDNKSRSSNSPLFGKTLKGKPLAVFNNNQFQFC